jgi:cAMP-binding proteins - catabolite gene activator and regulatory subunit of cAMP-dependent protein kinases
MPKPKGKEIQRRVATIYAVSYLAQRPYRAVELAKVLGVTIRTTYRILSDLRASNWLIERKLQILNSTQPNPNPKPMSDYTPQPNTFTLFANDKR